MDTYDDLGTIQHRGLTLRVGLAFDDTMRAPWIEHDGHGVVSEWTTRDKFPGERVLNTDRGRRRYYDVQASLAIARRDGWGLTPERRAEHEARLGRPLTPGEVAAAAVDNDFEHLRDWCAERWWWVGVVVTLLDTDGNPTRETASLWGIGSDSGNDYFMEVAASLADELADTVGDATHIIHGAVSTRVRLTPCIPEEN